MSCSHLKEAQECAPQSDDQCLGCVAEGRGDWVKA